MTSRGRRDLRPGTRRLRVPPWRVDVTVEGDVARLVPLVRLARTISAALQAAGAPRPASVGLILTGDAKLAQLNRTHLGRRGPTDILSFPLLPPEAYPPHEGGPEKPDRAAAPFVLPPRARPHLGDIVVSVERAMEQAESGSGGQTGDRRWSPADELRLLVTHGALHLCGWDHAAPAEEAAMRALERQLLGLADHP